MINGPRGWLWRAVDDAGEVLDILVQRHRSARAATRFFRKLLKGLCMVPRALVTDRLASYATAKAVVLPTVSHLRRWRQNNRVENSHQPVRRREQGLQRFKNLRHAARFCSVFSTVCNQFRPARHALSASNYRTVMRRRWREWDVVSETTTFAAAAEDFARNVRGGLALIQHPRPDGANNLTMPGSKPLPPPSSLRRSNEGPRS